MGAIYSLTTSPGGSGNPSPANVASDEMTESTTPATLRDVPTFTDVCAEMMLTNAADSFLYLKFFSSSPTGVVPSATDFDIIVPPQSVLSLPGTNDGIQAVSGATGAGKIKLASWLVPA
mgnify:CR=1 FL=1